ncbi:MAG: AAA family ATPase [Patescibacteria group bacterium]
MYLKSITIHGFKSFAKSSELTFTSPITAIVGPNGSGKSNVAEAFRFVLGEQSVKSMRGKRGEDLIWGGSESVSRANRARVALTFNNQDRLFELDYDEVTLERLVHRDGQNEYKLNGSSVRLRDIHELLSKANIGATGHHIISQGEADRILSAGAVERREMLEDALGLKVYQLKKQETERKLKKTEENIAQTESLRREAAPHLKYLKKQMERAARALETKAELQRVYAEYLKREDVYVAHHTDRLAAEIRAPQAALEKLQTELAALAEPADATVPPAIASAIENAEAAVQAAASQRQTAERALSQLEGQITFLTQRISQATEAAATETEMVPRAEVATVVEQVEKQTQAALSKGDTTTLERTLRDVLHTLRSFLKKAKSTTVDTTAADTAELERLQAERSQAAAALAEAQAAESTAKEALTAARAEQETAQSEQINQERERFRLTEEQRRLEREIELIEREQGVLERDRADFKQQLQEAVALLGRGATEYFTYEVVDDAGAVVPHESIVSEDRHVQRERQHQLEKLKIRLEELGSGPTEELQKEYQDAQERDEFLAQELADLSTSVENLRALLTDLDQQLREQFSGGLQAINKEFNSFFTLMFGGGNAALEEVRVKTSAEAEEAADTAETLAGTGIELAVSLPNKRVRGLDMLSGGERALTSIALIFAMSQVNPPPFIILDETDAALDEANSRRYGDMIEALAKRSQLVLITHNRETMSRAGILYGITMGADGVSKILSVQFAEAAAVAKA